jgi:hypothetical protein
MNRFIRYSLVVNKINYNILIIAVIITYAKSHSESSQTYIQFVFNYEPPVTMSYQQLTLSCFGYSGNLVIYPRHGPHRKHNATVARRRPHSNTSHVHTIQPTHWRADCCLTTSCNIRPLRHSFHFCAFHFCMAMLWSSMLQYVTLTRSNLHSNWLKFYILPDIFLLPTDVNIGIQIFRSYKSVRDFNMILIFNFHIT